MKKGSNYSKREQRIILLGYLWRWGCILIVLLIPAITIGICQLFDVTVKIKGFAALLFGISMLLVGVYDIVGTALEFKHILVSLQLMYRRPFPNVNPRRGWTKSEKKEYITIGIIFAVLGLLMIIVFVLQQLGVLS
ncbi:MAG: hypothetical protein IJW61_01070 [Clostridia bacterium]|nr:hypothetical protein [Clostridia bacterium]